MESCVGGGALLGYFWAQEQPVDVQKGLEKLELQLVFSARHERDYAPLRFLPYLAR